MESDEDDDSFGSDWDKLETITEFDIARPKSNLFSACASTELIGNGLQSRIAAKASTPVSLLVESLVQQLCALLEADPQRSQELYKTICERLHAVNLIDETYDMGEFEMMRSQYQKALYQLVSIARGQDLPVLALDKIWPLQQPVGLEWSRYHREFTELDFIAGGGFGKVYRARNNLDGIVYAVKKITIRSTTIKNVLVHLAEVKTLASLNHINIVPYKAAWLEPLLANGKESGDKNVNNSMTTLDDDSEEEEEESSMANSISLTSRRFQSKSRRTKASYEDSLRRADDTDDGFSIQFEHSEGSDARAEENNQQLAELEEARGSVISVEESQPHVKLKWATLYIQMTLCHLTLRQWLDERNRSECFEQFYGNFLQSPRVECTIPMNSFCRQSSQLSSESCSSEPLMANTKNSVPGSVQSEKQSNNTFQHLDVVTDILHQLLNGLTYIHSRGIVHHDIKPSNIFVSVNDHDRSLSIQLGDFGLACPLQSSHTGGGFGTPLYAAPEQLEGKCDPKSDIYSMGIILLELLLAFDTDMERAEMIKQVRKGQFPKDLDVEYSMLLKDLLNVRPVKRPTTFALTEAVNCMKLNRDKVISGLRQSITRQEEEIQSLRKKIAETDQPLEELNRLEIRTSETLIVKEQELIIKTIEIESKNQLLRCKEIELRSKDEEIQRLKQLLRSYQEKEEERKDQ
ncbi:eukaryotic translation initiation factor 2-alpha kinase 1-like [Toxorhynchites rutilus septentrionalis]|uniref:eukaryotic translation initiation factor 2-alpha kinase 1-like n=1 Tax=Toxorhynchites rutilus septentrionalis TaxID=329112 RepID=UPI002479D768|nr:eukaryotic translation initiation factor 2-alpha kinase 1-like [Toxorhynchites rutilus septentrionalis]